MCVRIKVNRKEEFKGLVHKHLLTYKTIIINERLPNKRN